MRARKLEGSVLGGEVTLPRHVSFIHQPAEQQVQGYRQAADTTGPSLTIHYRHSSLWSFKRAPQTTLDLRAGQLSVTGPGPEQRLDMLSIEQVFTTTSSRRGKWSLVARGAGRDHTLIDDLPSAIHAQHVEQLVEEFLAIDDDPALDASSRLSHGATKVLVATSSVRAEVVASEDSSRAHLRARTKRPAWSWVFVFGFLLVHNGLLFGGIGMILHPLFGFTVGLGAATFWGFLLLRMLINRTRLLVDDHAFRVQRGPLWVTKTAPLALQDVREVRSQKSSLRINGNYRYNVVARTAHGEVKLFKQLPRKHAQALGRALHKYLNEARRARAEEERARIRARAAIGLERR